MGSDALYSRRIPHELFPMSRRSIMLENHESKNISNLLIILPHQRYNSHAAWETTSPDITPGKIIQLLIQIQHNKIAWLYAGRYECIFVSTVPGKDTWAKMENVRLTIGIVVLAKSAAIGTISDVTPISSSNERSSSRSRPTLPEMPLQPWPRPFISFTAVAHSISTVSAYEG